MKASYLNQIFTYLTIWITQKFDNMIFFSKPKGLDVRTSTLVTFKSVGSTKLWTTPVYFFYRKRPLPAKTSILKAGPDLQFFYHDKHSNIFSQNEYLRKYVLKSFEVKSRTFCFHSSFCHGA